MEQASSAFSNGKDQVITNANILNAHGSITFIDCSEATVNALARLFQSNVVETASTSGASSSTTRQTTAVAGSTSILTATLSDNDGASPTSSRSPEASTSRLNPYPDYTTTSLPTEAISHAPSSCDVYIEQMFPLKHGYPLWYPEPDISCSVEYRRLGICIGDVGVIRLDGSFDFLFNIWLKSDDPINPDDLPEDFDLDPRPMRKTIPRAAFGANHSSGISSLKILSRLDTDNRDIHFVVKDGRKGALLSLPHGASKEDLRNEAHLKDFISKHALSWYKYARVTCGIDIDRHSLYVVTGSIKSKSWGIVTFDDSVPYRDSVLIMGETMDENGPYYEWKETGGASHSRTGPLPGLVSNSQNDIHAAPENQCLFLRGFKISLSEYAWENMLNPKEVMVLDKDHSTSDPGSEPHEHTRSTNDTNRNDVCTPGQNLTDNIRVTSFPEKTTLFHPLNAVNEILLSQVPNSDVAITHDSLWMDVMSEKNLQLNMKNQYIIRHQSHEDTRVCSLEHKIKKEHRDRLTEYAELHKAHVKFETVAQMGKTFRSNCLVNGVIGTGTGESKEDAEEKAANQALWILGFGP